MTISIKVRGIQRVQKFLSNKDKEAITRADNAIKKSGLFIEGEVKESIAGKRAETKSVDTGRFLNSVKTTQKEILISIIESNIEYAKHLEFGTSRMRPRRHFKNTTTRNEKKVKDFVEKEINKL